MCRCLTPPTSRSWRWSTPPRWSRRPRPSVIAERALDPDRQVALAALPAALQPAFSALWAIDLAMADVVAGSSQPALGAIRLAWWRERLEELDRSPPPAEPRLQQVATELVPRGITGAELAQLEEGWLPLLDSFPWNAAVAEGLRLRGRVLFGVGARLLGEPAELVGKAGALWSLADGARHCSDTESRRFLEQQALAALAELAAVRMPPRLRPLTVPAALAGRDLLSGKRGRGMTALRHQLTGRFPYP